MCTNRVGWNRRGGFAPAVLVLSTACRPPTEITVEVVTDIACADYGGTTITVGRAGEIENAAPAAVTAACHAASGRVGSLVVVPSGAKDDEVAIKVVSGFGRDAEDCIPPYGPGCVVARRVLRYLAHEPLELPVEMKAVCAGIPCEATQTCADGRCVSANLPNPAKCVEPGGCGEGGAGGTGGGGVGGASGGGAGGVTLACNANGTDREQDRFDTDGAPGAEWDVLGDGAARVAQTGGRLVFQLAAVASYATIRARATRDMSECGAWVAIAVAPDPSTSASMGLGAVSSEDGSTGVYLSIEGGFVGWSQSIAGAYTGLGGEPHDDVSDRWLRIRESGGEVHWETAPDGLSWKTRFSGPAPFPLQSVDVQLGASTTVDEPVAPADVAFDDFNVASGASMGPSGGEP